MCSLISSTNYGGTASICHAPWVRHLQLHLDLGEAATSSYQEEVLASSGASNGGLCLIRRNGERCAGRVYSTICWRWTDSSGAIYRCNWILRHEHSASFRVLR